MSSLKVLETEKGSSAAVWWRVREPKALDVSDKEAKNQFRVRK